MTAHRANPVDVLLVEDNPGDALMAVRALERDPNIRIHHVTTLAEAYAELADDRFDVVLLDLSLPDAEGLQALDRLPRCETRAVIVHTALDSEGPTLEALGGGAEDYLPKGRFDIRLLPRLVRMSLERVRGRAATALLAESEARFRSAFSDSPVGMALVSLEPQTLGRILHVNRGLSELVGLGESHLRSRRLGELFGISARRDVEDWKAALTGEQRVLTPAGQELLVEVHLSELTGVRADRQAVAHIVDLTLRRRAQDEAVHMALHDPLTGLSNRYALAARIEQSLDAARRSRQSVAVFYIDLDRFKSVNDHLGHDGGDAYLVEIAKRLSGAIRPSDTIARVGGDEFVAVAGVSSIDDARSIGARIQASIEEPLTIEGQEMSPRASVGVAVADNPDGTSVADLLESSDIAMYRAKRMQPGSLVFFDETIRREQHDRVQLESQLRHAVAEGRFELHYQPIVDLSTGMAIAHEALVRMVDESGALVPPAQFITVAEDSGLIIPIGDWVLEHAGRQQHAWNEATGRTPRLSINLSARQVMAPDFRSRLVRLIDEHWVDSGSIDLEITESTLLMSREVLTEAVKPLRELGARLAVDDFGTGFSSIGYLRDLPVDVIKLDRRFIAGLDQGKEGPAIVEAVVALGSALDVEVIAEGVETERQLELVHTLGVNAAQGFVFERPQPAEAIKLAAPIGA